MILAHKRGDKAPHLHRRKRTEPVREVHAGRAAFAINRGSLLSNRSVRNGAGTCTDTFARFRFDLSRRAIRSSTIGAHMSRTRLVALLAALVLFPGAARAATTDVVVSQVYGGGGNAGATLRNDYVELFNAGSVSVDLSGGPFSTPPPREHPGRRERSRGRSRPAATTSSSSHGTPTSVRSTARGRDRYQQLGGTSGKIALVRGAAALTCGASAGSCSADPLVEDLVGYGSASDFEGRARRRHFPTRRPPFARTTAAPTPATTRRTSRRRRRRPGTQRPHRTCARVVLPGRAP